MLCERCQRFDIQAWGRDPYPYRGVPLLSVIESCNNCSFCSLLVESLAEKAHIASAKTVVAYQRMQQQHRWSFSASILYLGFEWINFAITKAIKQPVAGSDGLNIAYIDAFLGPVDVEDYKSEGYVSFRVAADPGTPASNSQDITGQIAVDTPWSLTTSIESIQTWHRDCVSNHPRCCKTLSGTQSCHIESTLLPTRCIETIPVATRNGASAWRHVLRETADQMGQYVILSHRWDTETATSKTTAANYLCRMAKCLQETDHTPFCTSDTDWMPRLFVQTCILAHDLGIKYVWIDSICIRQGDSEDWNREAPRMAQYYQNSWVTVVAADNTMAKGLPNMRRKENVLRMARLPYMDRSGEQKGYLYLQRARPDELRVDFNVGVQKSELLQRGWVFQEWRLSRRIIAFSASDFFLYCHTSGSISSMGDHLGGVSEPVRRRLHYPYDDNIIQGRNLSASTTWENIVTEYSGLGLTCLWQDRLMALAGVASEIGRTMEESKVTINMSGRILSDEILARKYICGIWLVNLQRGLLWEQATFGPRVRLPAIPTWSWASMASITLDKDDNAILTGMSVRWPREDNLQHRTVYAVLKATTIPVDDQTFSPKSINHPVPNDVPENEYGNDNRFVVLTIHGSLIPVQIERLLGRADANYAEELTFTLGHRPEDYDPDPEITLTNPCGEDIWRGVCLPTDPNRLIGWVSVEDPDFQSDEWPGLQSDAKIASTHGSIYALLLERCEEKGSLFHWRRPLVSRVIFTVLFVREVDFQVPGFDASFVRVGVGRLFDKEVDKCYFSTEKMTISLI